MILNPSLFTLPKREIQRFGKESVTYGSLTEKGIERTVQIIQKYCEEPVYGFDLGCGDGELIWHFEKELLNSIWEGVELSEFRVSQQTRNVYIWQGDFLEENFHVYNVLHADNLCLTDYIADKLEEKITHEFHGLYISYRVPTNVQFLQKATLLTKVPTETTWGIHVIYYYWL
jgi:hypothetical protein